MVCYTQQATWICRQLSIYSLRVDLMGVAVSLLFDEAGQNAIISTLSAVNTILLIISAPFMESCKT